MAEKHLWATLRDAMKMYGHFERIENLVGIGRPDVNYCIRGCEGNIELKQLPNWPRKAETVVKVDHFTPQQRNWIRDRRKAGGRVFVLLEVVSPSRDYMLFDGEWARRFLGISAIRTDCEASAIIWESWRFPAQTMLRILTSDRGST